MAPSAVSESPYPSRDFRSNRGATSAVSESLYPSLPPYPCRDDGDPPAVMVMGWLAEAWRERAHTHTHTRLSSSREPEAASGKWPWANLSESPYPSRDDGDRRDCGGQRPPPRVMKDAELEKL